MQDLSASEEPDRMEQPRRLAKRHMGSVRCGVGATPRQKNVARMLNSR
jgi:hypothetical protein